VLWNIHADSKTKRHTSLPPHFLSFFSLTPTLRSRTRSYQGYVLYIKHALRHLESEFQVPSPLLPFQVGARFLFFFSFVSAHLHFNSGATKRETEPTSHRAYFSSRQVLNSLSLFRSVLCPLELTCAFHPRYIRVLILLILKPDPDVVNLLSATPSLVL